MFREPRYPARPAEGPENFKTAGQKLMGITLMTHIPDYFVMRRLKDPVQGYGQFHNPQIGS
jgi:hypothetical protein